MYPSDWPKCPGCGEPALDGHITCGDVRCNEAGQRDQAHTQAPQKHVCTLTIDSGTRAALLDQAEKLEVIAERFRGMGMPNHAGILSQAAEIYRVIAQRPCHEIRWGGNIVLPTTPQVPS